MTLLRIEPHPITPRGGERLESADTEETVETQPDIEGQRRPQHLHRVLTRSDAGDFTQIKKTSTIVGTWFLMTMPGVGMYAFNGFLGLTLGQAVIRAIHPEDAGYTVDVRSTMQVGALGGGVLGIAIWTVLLLLLFLAAWADRVEAFSGLMNRSNSMTKDIGALAFYTAVGAASGPLGVAILKHHRSAAERTDMLDVIDAARAGAFGWFLVTVSFLLRQQSVRTTGSLDE